MLLVVTERKNVATMQLFPVRGRDVEWGGLVVHKAELFRNIEVLEPGECYFVKVENVSLEGGARTMRARREA